ncbi:hypothetical protein [Streptomyces sp. NPDC048606]|uniref:hypothetical protein n=1 Tax=Streptomyces sp. NPDC048606 TaxID=3154726 RepID=UPI0034363155
MPSGSDGPDGDPDAPALRLWHPRTTFFVTAGTPFETHLRAPRRRALHGLVATYELTALTGPVRVHDLAPGCAASPGRVRCALPAGGPDRDVLPFALTPLTPAVGDAGTITARFTAPGYAPVTHAARVHLGRPQFRLRIHRAARLPAAEAATPPPITPAFVAGGPPAPGPVLLRLTLSDPSGDGDPADGPRLATTHTNCAYSPDRREAACTLPGPPIPGRAYETDAPLRAAPGARDTARGAYAYEVTPLDTAADTASDADARTEPGWTRGTGAPLGLRTVDADTLDRDRGYGEPGRMPFAPAASPDTGAFLATPLTLRGRVGQYVTIPLAYATNVRVDLPEGVSFQPPGIGSHPSEETYCGVRSSPPTRTGFCGGDRAYLTVRIDRRVEGAVGRVRAPAAGRSAALELVHTGIARTPDDVLEARTTPPAPRTGPATWAALAALPTAGALVVALHARRHRSAALRAARRPVRRAPTP